MLCLPNSPKEEPSGLSLAMVHAMLADMADIGGHWSTLAESLAESLESLSLSLDLCYLTMLLMLLINDN